MASIFRKDIEKSCAYCKFGVAINEYEVACSKRGIVDSASHCFRFHYDPLRRIPPRPASLNAEAHHAEDFVI